MRNRLKLPIILTIIAIALTTIMITFQWSSKNAGKGTAKDLDEQSAQISAKTVESYRGLTFKGTTASVLINKNNINSLAVLILTDEVLKDKSNVYTAGADVKDVLLTDFEEGGSLYGCIVGAEDESLRNKMNYYTSDDMYEAKASQYEIKGTTKFEVFYVEMFNKQVLVFVEK